MQHIDHATESLQLTSAAQIDLTQLGSSLPTSDACMFLIRIYCERRLIPEQASRTLPGHKTIHPLPEG